MSKATHYDMANRIPPGCPLACRIVHTDRHVPEFVSLIDIAPTVLDVMGIKLDTAGMSRSPAGASGSAARQTRPKSRNGVIGRERNDVLARPGTPHGMGYPVRGIREGNLLYLHNFAADRCRAGNHDMGLKDTGRQPDQETD